MAGIAGGVFTASAVYWGKSQTFPKGTVVLGLDIGGRSQEEAAELLKKKLAFFYEIPVFFARDGAGFTVECKELGPNLAVEEFLHGVMVKERRRPWWERTFLISTRVYPLAVPVTYDKEALERLYPLLEKHLGVPPEKARVSWDEQGKMVVKGGRDGLKVDKEATYSSLPAVYRGERKIKVKAVVLLEPGAVDSQQLQDIKELAGFITYFDPKNENRTVNLRKAALAINGAVIPPKGEFSFNSYVGPRKASLGYKEALVVVRNELTPGVGGGICQVSSTLYNACLLAGLEILERHHHTVAVPYVAPGLDATVAYPHKDLRFRNNMNSPVCLKVRLGKDRLEISIWGRRDHEVYYQVERGVVSTRPFLEVKRPSPDLYLGQEQVQQEGIAGYTVDCYLKSFDSHGNLLERKRISHDLYQPLTRTVLVGTKPLPAGGIGPSGSEDALKEEKVAEPDTTQTQGTGDKNESSQAVPVVPQGEENLISNGELDKQ